MMPENPQHRSKLSASSERMMTLVTRVMSAGRSPSRKGVTTRAASTASSIVGRTPKPADCAAPGVAVALVASVISALPRIDHGSLVDHLVAGLAGVVLA